MIESFTANAGLCSARNYFTRTLIETAGTARTEHDHGAQAPGAVSYPCRSAYSTIEVVRNRSVTAAFRRCAEVSQVTSHELGLDVPEQRKSLLAYQSTEHH